MKKITKTYTSYIRNHPNGKGFGDNIARFADYWKDEYKYNVSRKAKQNQFERIVNVTASCAEWEKIEQDFNNPQKNI